MKKIRLGIVGAAGRGGSFKLACQAHADVSIHAVCDVNKDKLSEACQKLSAKEQYADYAQMLDKSDINAVVIGTPMHLHVPQALLAIQRGMHVLSEVPAAVSLEECRSLVAACSKSKAVYMMAENYIYRPQTILMRELARSGEFGTAYYAEGEYLHELKGLNEVTKWRRKWQTGINGITYGTHSLGPILQCMPGDRVVSVCCAGSGHHYRDPRGDVYENEDSCVMLCKMRSGGLVKIRVDMLSDRPHAMTNYQLQGTDGCYESARAHGEAGRVWLRSKDADPSKWMNPDTIADEFLPQWYKDGMETAVKAGHGGGDYFEVLDFVDAIIGSRPCPLGVHETMDMTLPGLISQQSIAEGGRWLDVPDSRDWVGGGSKQQLRMVWPQRMIGQPPAVNIPAGYELRQYTDGDEAAYTELMRKAGFASWNHNSMTGLLNNVLPGGFFLIVHQDSGKLVATCAATHRPIENLTFSGELGCVAGDDEHKGKGLGLAVSAAALRRFIEAGYRNIYLKTDDFRLPAIKIYLKMGFEPWLCAEGMAERWEALFKNLNWKPGARP